MISESFSWMVEVGDANCAKELAIKEALKFVGNMFGGPLIVGGDLVSDIFLVGKQIKAVW